MQIRRIITAQARYTAFAEAETVKRPSVRPLPKGRRIGQETKKKPDGQRVAKGVLSPTNNDLASCRNLFFSRRLLIGIFLSLFLSLARDDV